MRIVYTIVLLSFTLGSLKAQYHENLMFGLKIGADYSLMTNITNTLVNDENKPMYKFSEKSNYLPAVSLFTHYRFDKTQVAVEGRISYYQIANDVNKSSLVTTAVENYNIRYQYLGLGL